MNIREMEDQLLKNEAKIQQIKSTAVQTGSVALLKLAKNLKNRHQQLHKQFRESIILNK